MVWTDFQNCAFLCSTTTEFTFSDCSSFKRVNFVCSIFDFQNLTNPGEFVRQLSPEQLSGLVTQSQQLPAAALQVVEGSVEDYGQFSQQSSINPVRTTHKIATHS